MNTQQLIQLSSQLNGALNQFSLAANASGEYPWQAQQREKRNSRLKKVAGAGLVGAAGLYGHQSIMNRASEAGPVRARDAYKAVGNQALNKVAGVERADKFRAVAGPMVDKVKAAAAPAAARVGAYGQNLKSATQAGMAGSAGMGWKKPKLGIGKAAMAALKGVRFSSAERLVELEAQLDGALVELGYQKTDRVMKSISRKMLKSARAGNMSEADVLMKKNNALVPKRKSKADSAMMRWSKSNKAGPARGIQPTDW